jgi:hypothetical protein
MEQMNINEVIILDIYKTIIKRKIVDYIIFNAIEVFRSQQNRTIMFILLFMIDAPPLMIVIEMGFFIHMFSVNIELASLKILFL